MLPTRDDDAIAIIDATDGTTLTFRELQQEVARRAQAASDLAGHVAFVGVEPRLEPVLDAFALVTAGATVAFIDPSTTTEHVEGWIDAYAPAAVLHVTGCPPVRRDVAAQAPLPESVLLPTSGSTGSPKFVRLTSQALAANAGQIVEATRITDADRALVHLPLHFSYGLSVLTSHLHAGASVVLSTASAMHRDFEAALADHDVTTLSGVPFSLEIYRRTGLLTRDLPSLRSLTTSGGRVPEHLLDYLVSTLPANGIDFWAMYGQTEASGRICVLPPEELGEAAGSVGHPVPGCRITIEEPDDEGRGQVIVSTPGAMLGYAVGAADLGTPGSPVDPLATGDIGRLDDAGRLWLTGRRQRIAKVYGERVSLDDVEEQLGALGVAAALDGPDGIIAVVTGPPITARTLERAIGLPPRSIRVVTQPHVPRTASGKVDYGRLAREMGDGQQPDA